jgi:hypothetical protein
MRHEEGFRLLRVHAFALAIVLAVSSTGCLGTFVETPSPSSRGMKTTRIHLLSAPFRIDAHGCEKGLAKTATYVPLWGVAVGILTIGIIVPKTVSYECVEG